MRFRQSAQRRNIRCTQNGTGRVMWGIQEKQFAFSCYFCGKISGLHTKSMLRMQRDRHQDRPGRSDEHSTKRIEIEADTDEGEQPADPQMPRLAKDHAQAQRQAERSDDGRETSG